MIFNKEQIENIREHPNEDGSIHPVVKFKTKRPLVYNTDCSEYYKYGDDDGRDAEAAKYLDYAYRSPEYEDILNNTATAVNINHTPFYVAKKLIDTLPDDLWEREDLYKMKFLDAFVDSGFTEKYLVRKLINNKQLKKVFPDYTQRLYHIMHNMVFGVGKTHASSLWARKIIYYSSDATIETKPDFLGAMFNGKGFSLGHDRLKLNSYKKTGNIKSPCGFIDDVDPLKVTFGKNDLYNYPLLDFLNEHNNKYSSVTDYYAVIFWDLFTDENYDTVDNDRRLKIMSKIKDNIKGYFDVIIGNPPYNTNDPKTGRIDMTIYDKFCLAAHELAPKYESFIIPAKFLYGQAKISDKLIKHIAESNTTHLEIIDGKTAFQIVDTGDVCIYSIDNTHKKSKCTFIDKGKTDENIKKISDCIIKDEKGKYHLETTNSIVDKIRKKKLPSITSIGKPLRYGCGVAYNNHGTDLLAGGVGFKYYSSVITLPDGTECPRPTLDYSLIKDEKHSMKCYMTNVKLHKISNITGENEKPVNDGQTKMGYIYIDPNIVTDYHGNDFDHDVFCFPHFCDYRSGALDYPYNGWILHPGEINPCQSHVLIPESNKQAENLQKYVQTKFVTYLIGLAIVSQNFKVSNFRYVPLVNLDKEWTDEKLNAYFNLPEEDIKKINDYWDTFKSYLDKNGNFDITEEDCDKDLDEEECDDAE